MWGLESWGTMIWAGGASVPLLGPLGLIALIVSFITGGVVLQSRQRTRWAAGLLLVGAVFGSAVAIATVTLPNTFVNGTIADADEVNANFDAIHGDFAKWSVELDGSVLPGTSVQIPDSVLTQLCADEDGCTVRLILFDWDMPNGSLAPSAEELMVYQPLTGYLRIQNTAILDDNGGVEQLLVLFNQCFLTDGEYSPGSPPTDGPGVGLLKWNNYPAFSGCRLTLID